jgi:hypothetical protein
MIICKKVIFIERVSVLAMTGTATDKKETVTCIPDEDYCLLLRASRKGKHESVSNKFNEEEPVELRDDVIYEKNTNRRIVCKSEILRMNGAEIKTNWGKLLFEEGGEILFRSSLVSIIYSQKRGTVCIILETDVVFEVSKEKIDPMEAHSMGVTFHTLLALAGSSNVNVEVST